MTRETKYNLIFIAILAAVLVPAAVILVKKKMREGERMIYLPPPLYTTAAYNDWAMTRPGIERIAPPQATAWVRQVAGEHAVGEPYLAMYDPLKNISRERRFEVLQWPDPAKPGQPRRAAVLWWQAIDADQLDALRWTLNGSPASVATKEKIAPPHAVRSALQDVGYVRPPEWVWWVSLVGANASGSDGLAVRPTIAAKSPTGDSLDAWAAEPADR